MPTARRAPIYEQGTLLFRDGVARHPDVRGRVQRLLLAAVDDARRGRQADLQLVRATLTMLVDLGVSSTAVYAEDFEARFLQETAQFFHDESAAFLERNTAPDYLRHAELRLAQEWDRGNAFLHPTTLPKVKGLLERTLVAEHAARLLEMEGSGLVSLLERDARDDLARMYALFGLYKQPIMWTPGAASASAAVARAPQLPPPPPPREAASDGPSPSVSSSSSSSSSSFEQHLRAGRFNGR